MKAMKGMNVNRMLGSLKRKRTKKKNPPSPSRTLPEETDAMLMCL